jgi:hypothetical protein
MRTYKGEVADWRTKLANQLGKNATLLVDCLRQSAPPGEDRLVIDVANKSIRRKVYSAIKASRGSIWCSPHLTDAERANKKVVYTQAHNHNLVVEDMGDMVVVTNKKGTGMVGHVRISMDAPAKEVQQELYKVSGPKKPRRHTTPAR